MSFRDFAKRIRGCAAGVGISLPFSKLNNAIAQACYRRNYSAVVAADAAGKLDQPPYPPPFLAQTADAFAIDAVLFEAAFAESINRHGVEERDVYDGATKETIRVHELSIQLVKGMFFDPTHSVVAFHNDEDDLALTEVRRRGLAPIAMYGIAVRGVCVRTARLVLFDESQPALDPFYEMWNEDDWLRGIPTCVKVDPAFLNACPRAIAQLANDHGIPVGRIEPHESSYLANCELFQSNANVGSWYDKPPNEGELSIAHMSSALRRRMLMLSSAWHHTLPMAKSRIDAYSQLVPRLANTQLATHADDPTEEQHALSRVLEFQYERSSRADARHAGNDMAAYERYDSAGYLWGACEIRDLLPAWPETPKEIARFVGATELQIAKYISGIPALTREQSELLFDLFSLRRHIFEGALCDSFGDYLLLGRSMKVARAAFLEAAHGGDLEFAAVIVPRAPSESKAPWHIIFFQACGGVPSFLLLPRSKFTFSKRQRKEFSNTLPEDLEIPTVTFETLVGDLHLALGDLGYRFSFFEEVGTKYRFVIEAICEKYKEVHPWFGNPYPLDEDGAAQSDSRPRKLH